MKKILLMVSLSVMLFSDFEFKEISNRADKFILITTNSNPAKKINSFLQKELQLKIKKGKLISSLESVHIKKVN